MKICLSLLLTLFLLFTIAIILLSILIPLLIYKRKSSPPITTTIMTSFKYKFIRKKKKICFYLDISISLTTTSPQTTISNIFFFFC